MEGITAAGKVAETVTMSRHTVDEAATGIRGEHTRGEEAMAAGTMLRTMEIKGKKRQQ